MMDSIYIARSEQIWLVYLSESWKIHLELIYDQLYVVKSNGNRTHDGRKHVQMEA